MRGVAHALAAAGFAVELPLLPGHGTTVEDMNTPTWKDWSSAAGEAPETPEGRGPRGRGGAREARGPGARQGRDHRAVDGWLAHRLARYAPARGGGPRVHQ